MIKKFNIFGKEIIINLYIGIRPLKTKTIYGYTNRCLDGKYIITLDYDCPYDNFYLSELMQLQKKYKLSDFYVLATNKGFHAVCLDKISLSEYLKIIADSSCDQNYKDVPFKHGKRLWTLRFSDKNGKAPYFISRLSSPHKIYKQSYPHSSLLNKLFDINIKLKNPDNLSKMICSSYKV